MTKPSIGVSAFLATQVYSETPAPGSPAGKFVVVLDDIEGVLSPSDLDSITVTGPSGYRFDIAVDQPCNPRTLNGYMASSEPGVAQAAQKHLWYMAFDARGFLADGAYTVVVRYRNGEEARRSNDLCFDSALLDAYMETRAQMSYRTGVEELADGSVRVRLEWTTLKELGSADAYYCARVAERRFSSVFDAQAVVFVDDILVQSDIDPEAGLNRNRAETVLPFSTQRNFIWFVEVLDRNRLEEINTAVFCPFIPFSTREGGRGRR